MYTDLLEPLLVRDSAGLPLVPEFFYVPRDKVHFDHFVAALCLISNYPVSSSWL